ncbi:diguanylate cyclase [Paenibacillus rhizovicinus]|uniref:Diguanylate cyclase n=1 Tax=Paenibacillus rhizovicinus TaxID=2704463 RepID=A0A6C0NXJ7_9BACL|nr:diguanylate cyclase [Paenibacillus rhizovicinus]QHW30929.1 diguanylate cyclase [Paenibacillus rhizovicinus]
MKIGEFAERNQVTAKMLRHYDEIGLLKPSTIDPHTQYRSYEPEQAQALNWIIILKNLGFSLSEIKEVLSGPIETETIIRRLVRKRIEIASALNEQIQKKIAIDRLIAILEKEGFRMENHIHLINIDQASVHEIKKNIPNMEMFLEAATSITDACDENDSTAVLRLDLCHFKQINDELGFDVGDQVIVACYRIIEAASRSGFGQAAIGRAYGDEFVVFARAGYGELQQTAQAIIDAMASHDYSSLGCNRAIGCYIGGMTGRPKTIADIRNMIDDSSEVVERARRTGPNSIAIEAFRI